jgi:hypothetical protein
LSYAWGDVLNPMLTVAAWHFEHAMRRHGRAWLRTLVRTAWPRLLWTQLRMEHPIRWLRLVLGACGMVLLTFVVTAAARVAMVWAVDAFFAGAIMRGLDLSVVLSAAWPYSAWDRWSGATLPIAPWPLHAVLTWAALPWTFLLLPDTLRTARVRSDHLWRIWAYSAAGASVVLSAVSIGVQALRAFEMAAPDPAMVGGPVVFTALVLWLWLFWWRAGALYLRIDQPALVALVMTFLAALAGAVVTALIPGLGTLWAMGV